MAVSEIRDQQVRLAAFDWLSEQVDRLGDVLPRALLQRGFVLKGERVALMSPQGIFKPKVLPELPLTITTVFGGPYDDTFGSDGLLGYRYRGTDPGHVDNVGLRKAMRLGVPLIYFHGVIQGKYLAVWPAYVVGDDPGSLTFTVAVDEKESARRLLSEAQGASLAGEEPDARRIYITSTVRQRLHQRTFRERVLRAYREQCALCRLRHQELLDAAHIVPDTEPEGEPRVQNGLALCKLHHAAFDRHLLGISPDYLIEIRQDILEEADGPLLKHGLQGFQHRHILLPASPRLRPDRDLLSLRYEQFRKAG